MASKKNQQQYSALKKKVLRGIHELNSYDSRWFDKIKPSQIDMDSVTNDILGQLFGSFLNGIRNLGIRNSENYGFKGKDSEESRKLKAIWANEIRKLKHKNGPPKYNIFVTQDDDDDDKKDDDDSKKK